MPKAARCTRAVIRLAVLDFVIRRALIWAIPLAGAAIVAALPVVRYIQKESAESAASDFLRRVHDAQQSFRSSQSGAGYAASFASLTTPCPGGGRAVFMADEIGALQGRGYDAQLRAARGATPVALDCHGHQTVSDYYAAAAPRSVEVAGQQAFGVTGAGRIFVFFDGIAPLESDMEPSGLATPLEAVSTFKIP